ncbi:pleckstrin homology domain-containing family F member 2-like [Gasterosteus aculeatus]
MDTDGKWFLFTQNNRERIRAVENSFGPSGKPLYEPGRFLLGEGRLVKMTRKGPQPRRFFLFNDLLVYGSIIGRWHKKQMIIPLEDCQLEDLENGLSIKNQWLIRTPRKSFYVAAASQEEKRAWIQQIEDCRSILLQNRDCRTSSHFAKTCIPDSASAICMRCFDRFSVTQRRHHCRKCGFLVCAACSKTRAVIQHIHPTKCWRICIGCHTNSSSRTTEEAQRVCHWNEHHTERRSSDGSSEEEEAMEQMEDGDPPKWLNSQVENWPIYVNLQPHCTTTALCTGYHSSSSTRTTQEAQQVCHWNERHTERRYSDGEDGSSEEEEAEEQMEDDDPKWLNSQMENWPIYVNLQPHTCSPEHKKGEKKNSLVWPC